MVIKNSLVRNFIFCGLLCISLLLTSCNANRKYRLTKSQQKTQHHEAKPAIKITQDNIENNKKNRAEFNKRQQKNTEKSNEKKNTKRKSGASFNFY